MYQYVVAELPKLNTKVPNIHYGGCCVFAEELYTVLKDLELEPKIYVITEKPKELLVFNDGKTIDEDDIDVCHVLIEVDGVLIDNKGMYKDRKEYGEFTNEDMFKTIYITIESLKRMNVEFKYWNRKFNREQIPMIKTFLTKVGNKVKKNLVK